MKRVRRYDLALSCAFCGGSFVSSRSDTRYCSALCRQKALRKRSALDRDLNRLITQLEQFAVDHGDRFSGHSESDRLDTVDALRTVKAKVDGLLTRYDY